MIYLYFLGLSFRNTAKALSFLHLVKISHVSIWHWIQKYKPRKYRKNKKIKQYLIDETAIKAGFELTWLWVVIEPSNKEILATDISKKRKYIYCQTISVSSGRQVWITFCFVRRWYLVSSSLQVFETKTSPSFLF
jgi:transposase-like protein